MKKIYRFLPVCVVMLFILVIKINTADAAPLANVPQTITQPNGEVIECFASGDEYFNYLHDADGHIIVKNEETGYYTYADIIDNQVVPTTCIYSNGDIGLAGVEDYATTDKIPQEYIQQEVTNSPLYRRNHPNADDVGVQLQSIYDEDKEIDTLSLQDMDINNLVIFIELKYQNKSGKLSFTEDNVEYYNKIFNTNIDSAKSYFNELTYGKMGVNSVFLSNSSKPTKIDTFISNDIFYEDACEAYPDALLLEAIEYANSRLSENIDLDKNNDGYVDMITFVFPGAVDRNKDKAYAWPLATTLNNDEVKIKGKAVNGFTSQVEDPLRGLGNTAQKRSGVICHELLHLLNFPDLYHSKFNDNKERPMGGFDIMERSERGHACAYTKQKYGKWIDMDEIEQSGQYIINTLSGNSSENIGYVIRTTKSGDEFFVVEYRTNNKFETLSENKVIIYRGNAKNAGNGNVNASVSDGKDDEIRYIGNIGVGVGIKRNVELSLYGDLSTGINIKYISGDNDNATIEVTFPNENVLFKDKNLENIVRGKLGKSDGGSRNRI